MRSSTAPSAPSTARAWTTKGWTRSSRSRPCFGSRGAADAGGCRLMQVSDVDVAAARRMFASLPTASVATLNPDGSPHVVPLWFVWPEDAVYLSTRRNGRTWANASADPRVAVTIDHGRAGAERAGV